LRFVELKPFPQLVPEKKEINAHLQNDGASGQKPEFVDRSNSDGGSPNDYGS
jgi:hypothetical protein